jgi:hypothetical protein
MYMWAPFTLFIDLKTEFLPNNIYSIRTSQETHYVSATKPNRLILFGEKSLFIVRSLGNAQVH